MGDQKQERKLDLLWLVAALAALVAAATLLIRRWRQRRAQSLRPPPLPEAVEGLTEAEAEARRLEGQDNVIELKPRRSTRRMWRDNLLTVFNLNLIGLAVVQVLMGRLLDALLSLGTIVLNVGLNVGQELWASKRLEEVERTARPQVTVIREQRIRSIDPSEIVVGDAVVIGPGDQVLVDGALLEGRIVVDESAITGRTEAVPKRPGDEVYAGGFCVSGRGACRVQKVGDERLIASRTNEVQAGKEELTAMERVVARVLRMLLVVVFVFSVMMVITFFRVDVGVDPDLVNDAASVIFGLAPSSLFFMIILTYAAGSADLSKLGALVHRARSVESLANATVICFPKAGILTGTHVDIEVTEPSDGRERLAESRLRQILGDYARTAAVDSQATQALAGAFEGNRRAAREQAPFLSAYGWSAIAFDDDDLRGTYVLGYPEVLAPHLSGNGREPEAEGEEGGLSLTSVRQVVAPVGRLFRRAGGVFRRGESEEEAAAKAEEDAAGEASVPGADGRPSPAGVDSATPELPSEEGTVPDAGPRSEDGETADAGEGRPNLFRRVTHRLNRVLRREEPVPQAEEALEAPELEEVTLLFVYHPDLAPLHSADGVAHLPEGLASLCTLRYSERVRPEAVETIQTFSATGVGIKVFTSSAPERTAAMLRQAGLGADDTGALGKLRTISGPELAELAPASFAQAAAEHTIFGRVTPEQAGQVVAALRAAGEAVAVVGDGVSDLPAMRQANLTITRNTSTQAALSLADIVLLEDSPNALSSVLAKGQRIANGLLDVLKLNLTQVFYLALLIVGVRLLFFGFPYVSAQGTIIAVATVALPSAGLTLWAAAGVLPSARLGTLLARFVAPASITMSLTALAVYGYFLEETGDLAYAQLAVTYTLVGMGLLLVTFIRPPWAFWGSRDAQVGDWRPTLLSLILMALFFVVVSIPLAQRFLKVGWLQQSSDYVVVGLAVLAWALLLRFAFLIIPRAYRP